MPKVTNALRSRALNRIEEIDGYEEKSGLSDMETKIKKWFFHDVNDADERATLQEVAEKSYDSICQLVWDSLAEARKELED